MDSFGKFINLELSTHSTVWGKFWFLIVGVKLVLIAVGDSTVYSHQQSHFSCNTTEPGCVNACYSAFAPLSHVGFWVFQVILITIPTNLYVAYAVQKTYTGSRTGRALVTHRWYFAHLLVRLVLEGIMIIIQLSYYGLKVEQIYPCPTMHLCPTNVVCFPSRFFEQSVYLVVMFVVSILCWFTTAIEIFMQWPPSGAPAAQGPP